MSFILDKLDNLANAADEAGQPRAAAELRAVRAGVAATLDRCVAVETLRDKFAMAALQSGHVDSPNPETAATRAYALADAMMTERAK